MNRTSACSNIHMEYRALALIIIPFIKVGSWLIRMKKKKSFLCVLPLSKLFPNISRPRNSCQWRGDFEPAETECWGPQGPWSELVARTRNNHFVQQYFISSVNGLKPFNSLDEFILESAPGGWHQRTPMRQRMAWRKVAASDPTKADHINFVVLVLNVMAP